MENIIILTTTFATKEDAEKMATALLEKRLVGCAQVSGPLTSLYHWQGEIESAEEFKLTLKTTEPLAGKTLDAIKEMHPYEVPEIVGQKSEICSQEYFFWLEKEVIRG